MGNQDLIDIQLTGLPEYDQMDLDQKAALCSQIAEKVTEDECYYKAVVINAALDILKREVEKCGKL